MPASKHLYLYLHTHWDREWYLTHEEYRTQLTFAAADILNKLKTGTLPSFLLDGQSCIIEDLEEVVPELCDEIRQLMTEKRLEAGPWYVLADQMLVSGESLIRNLEMGLAVTAKYGKPAMLGYCPDTFGHTQDLPRILSNFEIKTAFVWRGVPERSQGPLFWWESPDGSRVLTYHMFRGYYQTAFHDPFTTEKLAEFFLSWGNPSADFNSYLMPVGGDHLSAPNNFIRQLESARLLLKIESMGQLSKLAQSIEPEESVAAMTADVAALKGSISVQSCALSEFADVMLDYGKSENSKIAVVSSELRDNAAAHLYERAYMLAGVLSSRMYLKLQNRFAEKRLSRISEPVFTLLNAQKLFHFPQSQLNFAWRTLMRNHPHDSMCGCSVDAVHREMNSRFDKVQAILNVLDRKAFESMAVNKTSDVDHLFDALASHARPADKPSAASKKAVPVCNVDYKLSDIEQTTEEPQLRALAILGPTSLPDPNFAASQLLIANLSGEKNIGPIPISWCQDVAGDSADVSVFCPNHELTVQVVHSREENCIFTGTNQIPDTKRVRIFDGYVHNKNLPVLGFCNLPWKPNSSDNISVEFCQFTAETSDVSRSENTLSNEFFAVDVDTSGDIVVTNKNLSGAQIKLRHNLRDVGDGGDSYNFDPLDGDEPIVAKLIKVAPGKKGPLVASLILTYKMAIAQGVVDQEDANGKRRVRSKEEFEHIFETELMLKKSVPILFFETSWTNLSRNHRLEVVLDTGAAVNKTYSENHFSLVERMHEVGKEPVQLPVPQGTEAPLDRYPCQRFFIANEQAFFNNGLPEYGVDGSQVSLTILRAISDLSRADLRSRGGGAGPPILTDEANCFGLNQVQYAWAPLASASFGDSAVGQLADAESNSVAQEQDEVIHAQAQAVLEHLAQSASGHPDQKDQKDQKAVNGAKHRSQDLDKHADKTFKAVVGQQQWSDADHNVVNAYRLCEIFEGLHWSCFTKDVPVSFKSHVVSDNPAIRLVALRVLERSSEIEIRLLNVLTTPQTGLLTVQFAHYEARLTYADGRLIETLEAFDDLEKDVAKNKNQPIIRGKGKKKTPHDLANIATYRLELGANALISVRLQYNKG